MPEPLKIIVPPGTQIKPAYLALIKELDTINNTRSSGDMDVELGKSERITEITGILSGAEIGRAHV